MTTSPSVVPVAVVPVGTDPEAAAIAALCQRCGIAVHRPLAAGKPVHPGNAYQTQRIDPPLPPQALVWRVECDGPAFVNVSSLVVIDHHRPGDPGYGRPPQEYWLASSLGQIAQWIGRYLVEQGRSLAEANLISLYNDGKEPYWPREKEFLYVAAADHCLMAAYQGKCPDVDPEGLMIWRIQSRAQHQGRDPKTLLAEVEQARRTLLQAYDPVRGYADLRNRTIPELPEAAAREGIPFLAMVQERDGRTKVVLQAAPADLIQRFLAGEIVTGLTGIYGDPARGFAGGYLS